MFNLCISMAGDVFFLKIHPMGSSQNPGLLRPHEKIECVDKARIKRGRWPCPAGMRHGR